MKDESRYVAVVRALASDQRNVGDECLLRGVGILEGEGELAVARLASTVYGRGGSSQSYEAWEE